MRCSACGALLEEHTPREALDCLYALGEPYEPDWPALALVPDPPQMPLPGLG